MIFSTISLFSSSKTLFDRDTPRIATSGGLIIGVKPVPPIAPRLDMVNVAPLRSFSLRVFFLLEDKIEVIFSALMLAEFFYSLRVVTKGYS